ncbi:MucBP domain-containing protein, partial [Anaerococcus hydrogenalis]|uniref:MucBP domain-containing protein n=1 Tax=Anaerococcus hydrogenalis TaxID=33029 RepID=UPI0029047A87
YIANTKQEVTYIYQKTEEKPVEEKGSFQEHHIYITKDENGKVISKKVVDETEQKGSEEEKYTTGKKEKDGYKFVRVENPVNNPKYNEDGKEITGNYKPGEKQEITYVYEKVEKTTPTEEKGSFQEHHIYITIDKNGNVIKRDVVDGEETSGTKDDSYKTGKKEKDGYKLVKVVNPVNDPSYNEDGTPAEGQYKPGEKQEITYVYIKTVKDDQGTPGKEDSNNPGIPGEEDSNNHETPRVPRQKQSYNRYRKSNNPKMGVESISGILASLVAATGAMFASKKKKED